MLRPIIRLLKSDINSSAKYLLSLLMWVLSLLPKHLSKNIVEVK